jgi:Raf kinase inhibitor-like YbhB/YbcL family protein
MTRRRSRPLVAAMGIAVLVLLAACGSSGDDATTSAPIATAVAPAAATETTEAPPFTEATNAGGGGFQLSSDAFDDGGPIPRKFTCQGGSVSPHLAWLNVPTGTRELALLVVDPDAPVEGGFTHWVLAGIDPAAGGLEEGTTVGRPGASSAGEPGYAGPCPPSGTHHYLFTLYALAAPIAGTPDRAAIEAAGATALGQAVLTGTYKKS